MSPYRALPTDHADEQRRELAAFIVELRKMNGLPTERMELIRDAVVHTLQTAAFFYLAAIVPMPSIVWFPYALGLLSMLRLVGDVVGLWNNWRPDPA